MTNNPGNTNKTIGAEARSSLSDQVSERPLTFVEIAIVLSTQKKPILSFLFAVAMATLVITLILPNRYTATTKLLPPQQAQSNAIAILGQLGALAGGAGAALGVKNPSDIFVAMLKSRTVADKLVKQFELQKVYDVSLTTDARKELAENTTILAGREGVITVEVDDKDPTRAAAMANAYIESLEELTLSLAVSEAGQRRLFFEGQLQKAKQDLANAEIALQRFQEQTGIISPNGQAGLSVSAAAGLRAQITAKEVQLNTLSSFASDQNPDFIRMKRELEELRSQLAKTGNPSGEKGDVLIGVGKMPRASAEFIRKYRDLKYYETLFELLAKQYEIAKIDEAKDATLIQVLDKAIAPERHSKPKRVLIILLATVAAGLIASLWVIMVDRIRT